MIPRRLVPLLPLSPIVQYYRQASAPPHPYLTNHHTMSPPAVRRLPTLSPTHRLAPVPPSWCLLIRVNGMTEPLLTHP